MDDLEFEPHAREEMASDAISEDEIYHVIGDADHEYERDDGRIRYERLMEDGRHLVVIVEDATRVVRTDWWDKRKSRRRRRRPRPRS
jgi:hypothetical protein